MCLCVTALIFVIWSALAVFFGLFVFVFSGPTEETASVLFIWGIVATCNPVVTLYSLLLLLAGPCLGNLFQLKQTTATKPAEHSSTSHSALWPWLKWFPLISVIFYCLWAFLAAKQNSLSVTGRRNIQFGKSKSKHIYDPVTELYLIYRKTDFYFIRWITNFHLPYFRREIKLERNLACWFSLALLIE